MGAQWISVVELERIVGPDAATKLLGQYAGRDLFIRKHPSPELVNLIGPQAAIALSWVRGGSDIRLPMGPRKTPAKVKIIEMLELGLPHDAIAIECCVGKPYVEQVSRERRRLAG